MSSVTALAPWFGGNRMLGPEVGKLLRGCDWVGIPFAGGMSEVLHIDARTIIVNDLHRLIINLARVVADDELRAWLIEESDKLLFHPDVLANAQWACTAWETDVLLHDGCAPHRQFALKYFINCWMSRSAKAGTDDEFKGGLPLRWEAGGGDSNVRYRSAIKSLDTFGEVFRRCTFSTLDVFEFMGNVKDRPGHAVYQDQPFPGPGDKYKHKFGEAETRRLAKVNSEFKQARIVCRFYEHQLIREIYREPQWTFRELTGRKQSNADAAELLVTNWK